jgi:ferrous iron transport protein B
MDGFTIALTGNPNTGKTSIFNHLTGAHQHVGNWPGVTVEQLAGYYLYEDKRFNVVDLPGIYTFSASSIDETIALNFILKDKPDLVINVVDGSNLQASLYLTAELLEMRVPMLVVLNKMDRAARRHIHIELKHFSEHLDCPVCAVSATKKTGLDELRRAVANAARSPRVSTTRLRYDTVLEKVINQLENVLPPSPVLHLDHRWMAVKILEGDEFMLGQLGFEIEIPPAIQAAVAHVEKHTGDDTATMIADGRYGFVHGLARDVVRSGVESRRSFSDSLDRVMLNHILGIPVFLLVMYLMFFITINIGGPFIELFDRLATALFVDGPAMLLTHFAAPGWLRLLISEGAGQGFQALATFIPPVFLIFLCLSFLEDSGYLARGAFVMDRFLRWIGLPGKAFLPLLVGFGCNVPAILATRTLDRDRDRIMTIMMTPFMSCGARLPVYALFAAAFFPERSGLIIFSIYLVGILLAVITGLIFKHSLLGGGVSTFVMELPPYHLPTLRGIWFHTWNRLKNFIWKAGKVIIPAVMVFSILNAVTFSGKPTSSSSGDSVLCVTSRTVTPLLHPMGITQDNWPATVGLFTGVVAKEAVIGTLDALYAQINAQQNEPPDERRIRSLMSEIGLAFSELPGALADVFIPGKGVTPILESDSARNMRAAFGSRAAAYAYMLFVLLYIPCIATLGAVYRETNLAWTVLLAVYLMGTAWVTATAFYQVTTFSAHPLASALWLALCLLLTVGWMSYLKKAAPRHKALTIHRI